MPLDPVGRADVPVRDAATVMLLRDGVGGIEVFLLRRVTGMDFAGGMTVFPGGGVDPGEGARIGWAGPDPQWWAQRWGTDEGRARALVTAAVRETFEECGVLLAGDTPGEVVADARRYGDQRVEIESHRMAFADFLRERGLIVDSGRLRAWSRWITPVGETRRYDTHFFVAALPRGQEPDGRTSEAAGVHWSRPAAELDRFRDGETRLLPPTWAQLESLAAFDTVDAALAAQPEIAPIQPDLVRTATGWTIDFDGADRYLAQLPSGAL